MELYIFISVATNTFIAGMVFMRWLNNRPLQARIAAIREE